MTHSAPPRRRRPVLPWLAVLTVFGMVGAGIIAVATGGGGLAAPDWVERRIEARLVQALPDGRIAFEGLEVALGADGRPGLVLSGVTLSDTAGTPQASVARVEGAVAVWPLLRGEIELTGLSLSGAILSVRRDVDGRFDLALGGVGAGFAAPGEIVAAVDRWVAAPALARLDRVAAHGLTLRYEDARARRGWTADGGRLRLTREDGRLRASADFALLSGRDAAAVLAFNAESALGSEAVALGLTFERMETADIATQSPALAWLEVLDAPISGALRASVDATGALGPLHAMLEIGEGVLQPEAAARPIPFRAAKSYFTYDPEAATLRFDEIAVESDLLSATATGQAVLHGLDTGWPTRLTAQVRLGDVTAKPGGLYEAPVTLAGAEADLSVRLDPFELRLGRLRIADPALPLNLSGRTDIGPQGWRLALDAMAEDVTPGMVTTFWPRDVAPNTRRWVANNLSEGRLTSAQAALRAMPDAEPEVSFSAAFDGMRIRFLPEMPPIEAAAGHLGLHDGRFAATVHDGRATPGHGEAVDLAGTSFVIPDVRVPDAPAEVRLAAESALPAALRLVDRPPFRLLERAGRTPDIAAGHLSVAGRIGLELRPGQTPDDLDLDLTGVLRDVASARIVPGRQLTARRLDARLDGDALRIEGTAALDGAPVTARWTRPRAPEATGRLRAEVRLDRAFLEGLGFSPPPGAVSGAAPATLALTMPPRGAPRFELTSELDGLALSLEALGWRLGARETGALRVAGRLGQPAAIERLTLEAPGLSAAGEVALGPRGLSRARFERLRVGDWLDTAVTLRPRAEGLPPAVEIAGGTLDLRARPAASQDPSAGTGAGAGAPLSVALDRVTVSDGLALTDVRGELTAGAGLDGTFSARVNDAAAIGGTLLPMGGRTAVRIRADDAGRALAASGLFENADDGALDVTLLPADTPGSFDGALRVTDTRMRNTPALAALLDAMSIVGILDQLQGPGIAFSEVEARFRLTPREMILTEGAAVGPSMGVSLDGYVDLATGRMDMQGVLSPFYILNAVGSVLTRKGEGLFGINFRLQGTGGDPEVSVNPLSALTPGMFREIFRRPPPQVIQ